MLPPATPAPALRARRSSVGVFWVSARDSWRVRWRDPATGKMTTRHFAKNEKRAALAWAEGRKWEERQWGEDAVSNGERLLLAHLREALARSGRTLAEVTPQILALAGAERLRSRPPGEALEAFLAHCQRRNLRPATIHSYEASARRLILHLGDTLPLLSDLTRQVLLDHILTRYGGEATRQHARRHLLAWLRWSADQGWIAPASLERIDWPAALTDSRAIVSLSHTEAARLLEALAPRHRAACALGLFAGIRPEELRRVTWADIDTRRRLIRIPGAASKIREARALRDLPENLWAWLAAHPEPRSGPIVAITMRHWLARLRAAKEKARLTTWGTDILRKSFASHGFHLPDGPTQAAEIMGHLRGLQVYLRHYRDLRTKEEAAAYFSIRPEAGEKARPPLPD